MIWDTLEVLGINASFIAVVRKFYEGNKHLLKIKGGLFEGVVVKSGVRQGCPLSGLLFAICVDALLVRISKYLSEEEFIGAFADDIGIAVGNFWKWAPILQAQFQDFAEISGLNLNVKKTVLMPL